MTDMDVIKQFRNMDEVPFNITVHYGTSVTFTEFKEEFDNAHGNRFNSITKKFEQLKDLSEEQYREFWVKWLDNSWDRNSSDISISAEEHGDWGECDANFCWGMIEDMVKEIKVPDELYESVPEPNDDEESLPGAEQPYPEVKEVVISTTKPEVVDFFADKATPVTETTLFIPEPQTDTLRNRLLETSEARYFSFGRAKMDPYERALVESLTELKQERNKLKAEIETLKDRVMRLEMNSIRYASKVSYQLAVALDQLVNSGPAFPVKTEISKKDVVRVFEGLQVTLSTQC